MLIKDLTEEQALQGQFASWQNIYIDSGLMQRYHSQVDTIYHYTDLNGLLGIIQSQSFYASDVRFLNDRTEFKYGAELSKEVARSLINKENKNIIEFAVGNLEAYFPENKYVTCFSENGDLLQQWRSYAKDGRGVSIGFKFRDRRPKVSDIIPSVSRLNIIYKSTHQKAIIKQCFSAGINYFKSTYGDWKEEHASAYISHCIFDTLSTYISSFKHPCFEHEKECRFLYEPKSDTQLDIKFRTNGNLVIPFILLQNVNKYYQDRALIEDYGAMPSMTEMYKRLPISEIIIGPNLEFEPVKQGIEILLKENAYTNINIKQSSLPYRV